ncbi:aminotransferase [Novacetimonas maltaceti]|uniref:Histidinol-phosphate aminotransferase 2 n=1 Tax=Novacetimonas maltaceti TaxID=1203393 RepID=A0A2S3W618_9PROT|nr:pyridoxal phosphate-dependent aminotransferase [Novacetimonas maltaceti]POF64300.1 Histidinol-phosphate aminotransferase 2 [Novacetimonas maltaceti]PYD61442.1 aminotransferase [Novacetimonas maltaceti]
MDTDATLSADARRDLLQRGYSRRQFGRIGALLGTGLALASLPGRVSQARGVVASAGDNAGKVLIDSNEWWTGPMEAGVRAGAAMVAQGNRYWPNRNRQDLLKAVSEIEGVPTDHIMPWPGSGDPLCRAIVTFCSPQRGLVTLDPTYEPSWETAEWLKVPLAKVALRPENNWKTDVRAMLAANPNAGVYYICSPNNPTGTLTPIADIEWLVANKPAGSIVLVDEAYIHFAGTPSAASLVAAGKDVIVLRTFSKLFGMAGLRLGLSMGRPDLLEKMMRYDGFSQSFMLSTVALATGLASVTRAQEIVQRRNEMTANREMTFAHLRQRGISYIPSVANMFIVDWKRPAKPVREAFAKQGVIIGRNWPIWPNCSRITVGSESDMRSFCKALDTVIA